MIADLSELTQRRVYALSFSSEFQRRFADIEPQKMVVDVQIPTLYICSEIDFTNESRLHVGVIIIS